MRGKILIPMLAALLGIAAIVVLQQRATHSREAQLQLSRLKTDLAALQTAPYKASASTGGNPALAARLLRQGESAIAPTLASLRRSNPPAAVIQVQAPLEANFATLNHIYRIGISPTGYDRESDRLSGVAGSEQATVARLLDVAGRAYGQRATWAEREATAGGVSAILLLLGAFGILYRQNRRLLDASRVEALIDALTGLRNRRALESDLAASYTHARHNRPVLLGLFDLDGFKQYNDTFGHPAGDALLARLGERLQASLPDGAVAYRLGGDEFCILAPVEPGSDDRLVQQAAALLTESGETFTVTCSLGSALMPTEVPSGEEALRLADRRMYEQKTRNASAGRQSTDLLLQVLTERSSSLQSHVRSVGQLARKVAARLQLPADQLERIQLAAELHDIGKTAIPDSLLNKPGTLTPEEWQYMQRHTLIGERIILAAPALAHTAPLVRSSHERIDGTGYPDGLAGEAIPIGSRIIAVCDAYDAMISARPYRPAISVADAIAELHLNAGSQFDPQIVDVFIAILSEQDAAGRALAA